jgi:hypothetical protein
MPAGRASTEKSIEPAANTNGNSGLTLKTRDSILISIITNTLGKGKNGIEWRGRPRVKRNFQINSNLPWNNESGSDTDIHGALCRPNPTSEAARLGAQRS